MVNLSDWAEKHWEELEEIRILSGAECNDRVIRAILEEGLAVVMNDCDLVKKVKP